MDDTQRDHLFFLLESILKLQLLAHGDNIYISPKDKAKIKWIKDRMNR